mgnify:CR=1 FL=1
MLLTLSENVVINIKGGLGLAHNKLISLINMPAIDIGQ